MINDATTAPAIDMTASIDARLARIRARSSQPTAMPDRPTDTSRNGMRGGRTQKRRAIR